MSVQLFGKRELKRLASVANDGAGSGYSGFAKGMMAKMGWAEGQGLGKDSQGRSTYVHVKKKDDNAGLGKEKAQQNDVNDQWYFNVFDSALANMKGKKKKKDKKRAKAAASEGEQTEASGDTCMYEKMFKATGGARMGMRARAAQKGKLARAEGGQYGAGGVASVATSANSSISDATGGDGEGSAGQKRKRAADTEGVAPDESPACAKGGFVKQEKTSDLEEAMVGGRGRGCGAEKPQTSTKAKQKRKKLEAKKANSAGEAAQEDAAEAVGVERAKDVEEEVALGKKKGKKRKKKEKQGANKA